MPRPFEFLCTLRLKKAFGFYLRYSTSLRLGPVESIRTGTSISFSINSTYLRQFSGSLSHSVIPRTSLYQPGSTVYTGLARIREGVEGKSRTSLPSIS